MTPLPIRRVPFNFRLGTWTFLTVRLPLQVRQGTVADMAQAITPPPAPPASTPSLGSEGFLLRSSPVAGSLPPLSRTEGYIRYVPLQYTHYYIDLSGTFEGYLKKFSSKTRSTMQRKIKRLSSHVAGNFYICEYGTKSEITSFLTIVRPLSMKTYQERLFDGGIPQSDEFYEYARNLAAQRSYIGYILFADDKAVAYMCGHIENKILYYDYVGYDPEWSHLSVGSILLWHSIEKMFNNDAIRFFDFTEGESEQKSSFSNRSQRCANIFFINARMIHYLIVYSHFYSNKASHRVGMLLEKIGIKKRLKKLIHGQGRVMRSRPRQS